MNSPDTIDNILKTHDIFFSKYKCTRNVKMCIINQFGWVQLYHLLTQECIPVGCVPTTAVPATRCHYGWGGLPNSPPKADLGGLPNPPLDADLLRQTQGDLPNPLDTNPLPLDPDLHSPSGCRPPGYRPHGCRAPSPCGQNDTQYWKHYLPLQSV